MPGDGSHCKGGAKNITYEKNRFINCAAGGLDVGGDTGPQFFCPLGAPWEADSIKVYSNIFIGGTTGIRLSACHNSSIYNNTCFKTTQFAFRSLNASSNNITLANNHISNNIFTTEGAYGIYMNASADGDYATEFFENNLFHDYKRADPSSINWSEMPGVNVSGSIIGDPMFKDTAGRDFSLLSGSPAMGAGAELLEPMADYNGRPFLSVRSIGAIESGQASEATIIDDESLEGVQLFPNPCRDRLTIRNAGIAPVRIIDEMGRVVRVAEISNHGIDLSDLPNGH
jgi:parallel beta-helix repeat protein